MIDLPTTLLSNALLVVPLVLLVLIVTRFVRHPGVAWALWGLVLLKFVTPALLPVPVDVTEMSPRFDGGTDADPLLLGSTIISAATAGASAHKTGPEGIVPSVVTTELASSEMHQPAAVGVAVAAPIPDAGMVGQASGLARLASRGVPVFWGVWIAGSLLAVAVMLTRIVRFRSLLQRAGSASAELTASAQQLARRLGLNIVPDIRLTDGRVPPLLFGGVRRATILLPRGLLEKLDNEAQQTLLAHELAHVARRDHWTRWLELAVRCLYWWHPVAWWAGRRLRDAEEQCCDARVVSAMPESAAAYAQTILSTVDFLAGKPRSVPVLATGLEPMRRSVRPLHRRLSMIVKHQPARRTSWGTRVMIAAVAAGVLPAALIAPTHAESDSADLGATSPALDEVDVPDQSGTPSNPFVNSVRQDPLIGQAVLENTPAGPHLVQVNPLEEQQESTITVERRSYPIDGSLGGVIVRLLEQMQRSRLVDPLLAHVNGGNGAFWNDGKWQYQTSITVVTIPEAHKAIGSFVDGLRELRPAPGQKGAEELTLHGLPYERQADWSTSQVLLEVLQEANKLGVIRFVKSETDDDGRLVILTTPEVHDVLRPFVAFLNERQARRDRELGHEDLSGPNGTSHRPITFLGSGPGVGVEIGGTPTLPGMTGGPPQLAGQSGNLPAGVRTSFDPSLLAKRPQVLTTPQEYEEITVVARTYLLHPDLVKPLGDFLHEVRDGFPLYSMREVSKTAGGQPFGMGMYGGGYGSYDAGYGGGGDASSIPGGSSGSYGEAGGSYGESGYEGMAGDMGMMMGVTRGPADFIVLADGRKVPATKLRIVAPESAQTALAALLEALGNSQAKQEQDDDAADEMVLVRAQYELAPRAAAALATLLQTCENEGLASPLLVRHEESRIAVTARKELQTRLHNFITYLGEHWKMAGRSSVRSATDAKLWISGFPAKSPSKEVLQADLKVAAMEMEIAESKLELARRLVEKGITSETELKAAELELLKAQRNLTATKAALDALNPKTAPTSDDLLDSTKR